MTPRDEAALQPVWDGYCADPFVVAGPDGYTMYGSAPGPLPDGLHFQTLHSNDLVSWADTGGALEPLPGALPGTEYWAPEVVQADGVFWMYYSAGVGDKDHHLRVATAEGPQGPFRDVGVDLTPGLTFAIDPSPFRDDDGSWWLYFATDQLDTDRPGTSIAVAPMTSMLSIGPHTILLTATADWQRYQADREIYGGVRDWHTLEGPQVVRHDDRYWMCYSGGNWHQAGYGVALAAAGHPQGPWHQQGDGATFLSSAKTGLTGPGHNSLLTDLLGFDRAVFHAWDEHHTRRRPYVAALDWTSGGPCVRDTGAEQASRSGP